MSEVAADIPDGVADAVDVMVDRHGLDDAETELQRRFRTDADQERVAAAIAYLRREYPEVSA